MLLDYLTFILQVPLIHNYKAFRFITTRKFAICLSSESLSLVFVGLIHSINFLNNNLVSQQFVCIILVVNFTAFFKKESMPFKENI